MDNSLKTDSSFPPKCSATSLISSVSANPLLQLHREGRSIMFEAGRKIGRDGPNLVLGARKMLLLRPVFKPHVLDEITGSDSLKNEVIFTCWACSQMDITH